MDNTSDNFGQPLALWSSQALPAIVQQQSLGRRCPQTTRLYLCSLSSWHPQRLRGRMVRPYGFDAVVTLQQSHLGW